jgi:hypothetical protein
MALSDWFREHLQASGDGLVWAIEQVPLERRFLAPPALLGEWSAARHLFHMLYYDQQAALKSMRHWLGGPLPSLEELDEDAAWGTGQEIEPMLAQFRAIRAEQIELLPQFDAAHWEEPRAIPVWETVTLRWVVTKTYQHTAEHIHDILSIALFWDFADKPAAE